MAKKKQASKAAERSPSRVASRAVALTIAGSDSAGCAGLQADLKTFAALGVHGTCVVTAVTAQNTTAVESIHRVPAAQVRAQLEALLHDFHLAAIKTGMLASASTIDAIAEVLDELPRLRLVVDPVLVSTSGTALLPPAALLRLRQRLLPRALVLTPNIPEAEVLLGRRVRRAQDLPHAARDLLGLGPRAVLLKGGHLPGTALRDVFVDTRSTIEFAHARVPARLRGTGCSLAAAVTAGLARGIEVEKAVAAAERFIRRAIAGAYRVGRSNRHALDALA